MIAIATMRKAHPVLHYHRRNFIVTFEPRDGNKESAPESHRIAWRVFEFLEHAPPVASETNSRHVSCVRVHARYASRSKQIERPALSSFVQLIRRWRWIAPLDRSH